MREQDLRDLLRSMSLEEKVGQMVQVTGAFLEEDAVITGPAADAGLTADDCRLAGSILGIAGAKRLREIQDRYMEAHPHHIPLLMMADVIHGYKTEFPIPLALGASFCPEAVERAMGMAAAEAASAGLHVTFSPMTDLVRDPRWGRVLESFGESPWLDARRPPAASPPATSTLWATAPRWPGGSTTTPSCRSTPSGNTTFPRRSPPSRRARPA